MQQLVLMVEEVKQLPAAKHDRFVKLIRYWPMIEGHAGKLEHNGSSVFDV